MKLFRNTLRSLSRKLTRGDVSIEEVGSEDLKFIVVTASSSFPSVTEACSLLECHAGLPKNPIHLASRLNRIGSYTEYQLKTDVSAITSARVHPRVSDSSTIIEAQVGQCR
jgi:hypothetical protein